MELSQYIFKFFYFLEVFIRAPYNTLVLLYRSLGHNVPTKKEMQHSRLPRKFCSDSPLLTEYKVTINTCGSLYDSWRQSKKFKNVPEAGLTFTLSYIDTRNKSPHTGPTVVVLHGVPGKCHDFGNLIRHLHGQGARVVVPTYPDFAVLDPGIFRHTPEEKCQLMKDFLNAISVSEVDLLVVHSASVYTALALCLEEDTRFKSMVMLNVLTHSMNMLTIRHYNWIHFFVKAVEVPLFFRFVKFITPLLLKLLSLHLRVNDNQSGPLLSATAMIYADIPQSEEKFLRVSKKIPILFAFSHNDKLIGKQCCYELASLLGASPDDIFLYDTNGSLKQEGRETPSLKVMAFEAGSHYLFSKHPGAVNRAIEDFMMKNYKRELVL